MTICPTAALQLAKWVDIKPDGGFTVAPRVPPNRCRWKTSLAFVKKRMSG
jgi:hypothetical protein